MSHQYQAVIFDLDGTLVDSYEALLIAVNSSLLSHGEPEIDLDQLRGFVGEGIEPLLTRCFRGEVPATAHDHFMTSYDDVCAERSTLLDDVEETLATLDDMNIAMAVCTNKTTSFSRKILEALNVARFFQSIVGPDLVGARKPDPRHVLHALSSTKHRPSNALFVGDMPIDVEAAQAAGLHVAAIATGSADRDTLLSSKPEYMLERFGDLVGIVTGGTNR